jgi:hypothetical protein
MKGTDDPGESERLRGYYSRLPEEELLEIVAVPRPWPKKPWKCHACGREWKSANESSADSAAE